MLMLVKVYNKDNVLNMLKILVFLRFENCYPLLSTTFINVISIGSSINNGSNKSSNLHFDFIRKWELQIKSII